MNPLDAFDAAMMTGEVISNPMHIGAVLILSPPADAGPEYLNQVYSAATASGPIDPRLRRYPHCGLDTAGVWVWREVDAVDVQQHCERRTVSSDWGGFWRLIGELDAVRLARSRPMWMSYLIDGLEDDRFAFYIKVHHTVIDGVAGLRMIADALSDDPLRRGMAPFYADRRGSAKGSAPSRGLVPRLVAPIRSGVNQAASGIGLVERLVTGELATVMDTLIGHTTVLPFGAPYTRFNGRLGPERAVCAGSWAKKRIRAIQEAADVTANDVITAIVAGVLRQWLRDRGELPSPYRNVLERRACRGDLSGIDGL